MILDARLGERMQVIPLSPAYKQTYFKSHNQGYSQWQFIGYHYTLDTGNLQ